MFADIDARGLHAFIRGLSDEIEHQKTLDHRADTEALAVSIRAAQDAMLEDIAVGLSDRLERAAVDGERSLRVLEFKGGDTYADTDLNVLYLVKGPREPEQRDAFREMGLRPLLARIRDVLGPFFAVRHTWEQATNGNAVALEW